MACFLVPMGLGIIISALKKRIPKTCHIDWLNIMLWGGVIMLAIEHLAHKEVVLYPPFLTAGTTEIISEMLGVGGPMTISVVAVWAIMVILTSVGVERKKSSYTIK